MKGTPRPTLCSAQHLIRNICTEYVKIFQKQNAESTLKLKFTEDYKRLTNGNRAR